MKIILTGGGTGGHIFPLIAVARKLRIIAKERGIEDIHFLYVGPRLKFAGEEIFKRENIHTRYIFSSKLRRYVSYLNIIDFIKFPFVILQALWILFWNMPDAVFSKGSFGSFPVMLASWLFFIPSRVIHESDSVPGLANIMAAGFAKRIGVAFHSAALKFPIEKTAVVGLPVRSDLCGANKQQAKMFFNILSDRPVILITGGSQGSKNINEAIVPVLLKLLAKYEVIHLCGVSLYEEFKKDIAFVKKQNMGMHYHLYPFLTEEIKLAFALASIVISRAGASGIFEVALCGKPSILIPITHAQGDHQRKNAYEYAKIGATIIIEEDNLTPNLLYSNIIGILEDKIKHEQMASSALSFFVKDSAEMVAKEILQLRGVI